MRALVISDKVEPILYGPGLEQRVGKVDLVLSCGDLPFYYIEFIISVLNRPSYYVFGNHGSEIEYQGGDWKQKSAPQGAENLHRRVVREGSLLLAGLEGSIRYNNARRFQYTNRQMWMNILQMAPGLMKNRLRYGRWLDVLVAHSPPFGIHDQPDRAHQGFTSFLTFMRWFKPRYLLHGHIHLYRQNVTTVTRYVETDVINVYPYRLLDLEIGR
ncbi:MAG: metallophosphoesterase [Caldilineaceae bacterium]|nr:metallophosphoesterase [Caldilineaceae bacterium]